MNKAELIKKIVCEKYNLPGLCSVSRDRRYIFARAMFVKLLRDELKLQFAEISALMERDWHYAGQVYKCHKKHFNNNTNGYRWDFQEVLEQYKSGLC